jgi:hypothetical protein
MAVYYVDSSGLVKRYITEVGSAWVVKIAAPIAGNEVYIARITGVEVVSALVRRARGGTIDPGDANQAIATFKNDLQNEYQIVEVTEPLVNRAIALAETHGLRGYDAVQLAAACEVNRLCMGSGLSSIVFVSADRMLNTAATAEGLAVENPNDHS